MTPSSPFKRPTRALFWDIDGTLLVTGRAGMIAWERAFAAATGGRAFPSVRPDGLTDHQIAGWLLGYTALDRPAPPPEQAAAASLVRAYESGLADALPLRQGRVLGNARELLEWVDREQPALVSWLVTGNTRTGATAKLRHYELSEFFRASAHGDAAPDAPLVGSFSTHVEPRAHIVRRALQMAQSKVPGLLPSEVLVVGDTPHDIEGAHALGVPVLAVATNVHTLDELSAHHPWRAMPALPAAVEFKDIMAASG
jgi:phosphoglycolate phosphatase-like HAD superfamily hydrolase